MTRTFVRALAACVLLIGCGSNTVEPLPLDISIQASRVTAAPGDSIDFVANVQGQDLLGVDVDFGDGSTDQRGTGGARTGKLTFRHAFTARGAYTTKITVTDGAVGQKTASVLIQIF
jgi:plastocyanin